MEQLDQADVAASAVDVTKSFGQRRVIYGLSFEIARGEIVGLWDARATTGARLSGGMQRRLQLAATLLHDPHLIVLDEPTAGVDPVLRARFWEHFRRLRDEGRTVIVTTQYVTEAEYCDSLLVLKDGRIIARGSPDDVRRTEIGGDVVQVAGPDLARRADELLHSEVVHAAAGVRAVRRLDDDRVEVIVGRANVALPLLLQALRDLGIDVDIIEAPRASFDDVFVHLMHHDAVEEHER